MFFISGFSSLVYQVAWVRILSLFFGGDVYSATITLSVFMSGLALGAWLISLGGDRFRRPLIAYGIVEVAVGIFALAVPSILAAFQLEYGVVYNAYIDTMPSVYHGFRVIVATSAILLPTLLMGATLPLLVRYFVHSEKQLGQQVGKLYALNTLGAFVGTYVAGFVLLPNLGVSLTVNIAVGLNLLLGALAVGFGLRRNPLEPVEDLSADQANVQPGRPRQVVLVAIFLSGLAALALEVVWARILIQSFSSTVYAFSIMLASFLFGIYYGSLKASRHVRPIATADSGFG